MGSAHTPVKGGKHDLQTPLKSSSCLKWTDVPGRWSPAAKHAGDSIGSIRRFFPITPF